MAEIFKTVLILSIFGFCTTALLLRLKPVTAKKFPAKWQYYVWIAVLLSMIIPAYKLVPFKEVQKIPVIPQGEVIRQNTPQNLENEAEALKLPDTPAIYQEINITSDFRISIFDLLSYIWFSGMCIFMITVIASYIIYITQKRKKAVKITENAEFDNAKKELKIKRRIKIRMSADVQSPMLTGILFPVVYLPCREIPDENLRMVFLHELTHYKRKDLLIKWLSIFVNAVHWFNPLAYLLCANISEACEISCDMSVTKNMSESEQKAYMKTILDLVE